MLNVPSTRKPSEADSGYCGPSRETSTTLLKTNSDLPIVQMNSKQGILLSTSTESLPSSHNVRSSSLTNVAEEAVRSEDPTWHFTSTVDLQRATLTEASQPNVVHFSETHLPLSLTLSYQITVTSSTESQSQPSICDKSAPKSTNGCSEHELTAEQREDILKRTVENKTHLFTEYTNFVALLSHLYARKLLQTEECEKLEKFSSCKEKSNHFYTLILPRKGKRAYTRLHKCLKKETGHLGHRDLVEILDRALEEQHPPPQSSSESSPTDSVAEYKNLKSESDTRVNLFTNNEVDGLPGDLADNSKPSNDPPYASDLSQINSPKCACSTKEIQSNDHHQVMTATKASSSKASTSCCTVQ